MGKFSKGTIIYVVVGVLCIILLAIQLPPKAPVVPPSKPAPVVWANQSLEMEMNNAMFVQTHNCKRWGKHMEPRKWFNPKSNEIEMVAGSQAYECKEVDQLITIGDNEVQPAAGLIVYYHGAPSPKEKKKP